MKTICRTLTLLALGASLAGCVDVDKETAATPREYWNPTPRAQPDQPLKLPDGVPGSTGAVAGNGKLSLSALVDIALSNNPTTRQAWYNAKAAAAQLGETNSQYYPQITVGANLTRNKLRPLAYDGLDTFGSTTYSTTYGPSVEISYLLWDFGQNYAQTEAARQALYVANYQYNQQIQDVILDTQLAYFNLNAALGLVDAAQQNLNDADTIYKAAQIKLQVGSFAKQDELQALAQVKNAEFSLDQAQSQVEQARAELATALGVPVSSGLDIVVQEDISKDSNLDNEVSSLMAQSMRMRPALMAAYANVQATKYDVEAAKAARWPQLNLVSSDAYGYGSGGVTDGNPSNNYSVGLQLSWQIFTGFNRTYAIITAQEQERAAEQSLRAQELKVVSDVWGFFYSFKSAVRQVEATTAELDAQNEAYNAIQIGFNSGQNSYVELLTAQANLASSRKDKVQAEANLGSTIANLAHATGNLPLGPYTNAP